jgi:hypothetical protein
VNSDDDDGTLYEAPQLRAPDEYITEAFTWHRTKGRIPIRILRTLKQSYGYDGNDSRTSVFDWLRREFAAPH